MRRVLVSRSALEITGVGARKGRELELGSGAAVDVRELELGSGDGFDEET